MKRTLLAVSVASLTILGCTSVMNSALPPGRMNEAGTIRPELFFRVSTIIEKLVLLTEDMTAATRLPLLRRGGNPQPKVKAAQRKGRR